MPSYDNKVLTGDQLVYFSGLVKTALAAKQDSLVFNTAYDASNNKVATMADVDDAITYIELPASVITAGETEQHEPKYLNTVLYEMNTAISGKQDALVFNTAYDADNNKVATMSDVDDAITYIELPASVIATGITEQQTPVYLNQTLHDIDTTLAGKQDSLVFNTAYNASSNKVATMSDITSALSNVGSFSFEIVQSLPSQDISTSKIYLVAKQTAGTNQVYTEYAYVNNAWEIIGDTSMSIDTLSNQEVATIWSTATATT